MRKSMMCGFVSPPGPRLIELNQREVVSALGIGSDFVVKNVIGKAVGVLDKSFLKNPNVA